MSWCSSNTSNHGGRSQSGVALLEVLISVLVLSLGLLGIALMQATALRNNQSSLERTQAVIQTYSIFDAMRANRERALIGEYNIGMTCRPPTNSGIVAEDIRTWINGLHQSLNDSACGSVACDSDSCLIRVQWDDSRAGTGEQTGEQEALIETRGRL